MTTRSKRMEITPDMARQWLNSNVKNRALRTGQVEKYARDMSEGKWTECAAPIVFYADGELADGQHRLWAIVESDTTQSFIVIANFPRDAGLNIDRGIPRTLVDNVRIGGDIRISDALLATARAVEDGEHTSKATLAFGMPSSADLLDMLERHREACEFAVSVAPKAHGLNNALVRAALARAWYVEKDRARLADFGRCATGYTNGPGDSAAVAFRNWMVEHGRQGQLVSEWRATFLKVQNLIKYFMRRKQIKLVKAVGEETYPLTDAQIAKRRKLLAGGTSAIKNRKMNRQARTRKAKAQPTEGRA